MFVCAGKSEQFDFAHPIGIGLVESAVNLTRICELGKPEHIVFVGTAGSYGEKEIFEIVESRIATNVEQSFFEGKSYTPIDNVVASVAYGGAESTAPSVPNLQTISSYRLLDGSHVSRETIVNSSNYITIDPAISKQYLSEGIDLENMEFYAVMKTAQYFGIPARGIFAVTNYCDPDAHNDFTKHHAQAMKLLTQYVESKYV